MCDKSHFNRISYINNTVTIFTNMGMSSEKTFVGNGIDLLILKI